MRKTINYGLLLIAGSMFYSCNNKEEIYNYISCDSMQVGVYMTLAVEKVDSNYKYSEEGIYLLAAPNQIPATYREDKRGMALYIINSSDSIIYLSRTWHDNFRHTFYLIQEAKDEDGEWKPIECLIKPSSIMGCGVDMQPVKLEPHYTVFLSARRYMGSFKTELRFRLFSSYKGTYNICSTPFKGSINKSQFIYNRKIDDFTERVLLNDFISNKYK